MTKQKNFLWGAFILGGAGVISRVLGAVYRIPLARLIGDEGMGLYQMAYPIYTTILALATAGIPVAISILVARKETQGYPGDSRRIFRVTLGLLLAIGTLFTGILFISAGPIARGVLGQPGAELAIIAISPAIFFAAMLSVFRGYFQGYQYMIPTAVSQVVEQIFRVTFILILSFALFKHGLEWAAAGATFGAVIGAAAGLVVLIGFYIAHLRHRRQYTDLPESGDSAWGLGTAVLALAVPVSLGAVVMPLVQMLDAALVPRQLIVGGFSGQEARALFGQLSGMASVLVNLPMIFTVAIGTSLVPSISEALAKRNHEVMQDRVNNAIRVALIIAMPAAVGLFVLAYPICGLLFDSWEAGMSLKYLSMAVISLALFQITAASLQGIGHPTYPMVHLLFTGALKVGFNLTLTSIPSINIAGPAVGTVVAFLFGAMLNLIALWRFERISLDWLRVLKLGVLTGFMGLAAHASYQALVSHDLSSHIAVLAAICVGGAAYVGLLYITGEFNLAAIKQALRGGNSEVIS
ncbi:MAG: putative polysaccharide biosynthesis protein [Solirubrobacterales bacterium]